MNIKTHADPFEMAKQHKRNRLVDLYLLMDLLKEKLQNAHVDSCLKVWVDVNPVCLLSNAKSNYTLGKKNVSLTLTYSLKRFCIGRRPSVVWSLLTLFLKLV